MSQKRTMEARDAEWDPEDFQDTHKAMSQYVLEGPTAAIERFRSLYMALDSDTADEPNHPIVALGVVLSQRLSQMDSETSAGDFWRACVETEFLLLLLDIIEDPNFFRHSRAHANVFWERIEGIWTVLWAGRENLRWPARDSTGCVLDAIERAVDDARYLNYGPPHWFDDDPNGSQFIKSSMVKLASYAWAHGSLTESHHLGLTSFTCASRLKDEESPAWMPRDALRNCFITLEAFLTQGSHSLLNVYYRTSMFTATCVALRRHITRKRHSDFVLLDTQEDIGVWIAASAQILRSCKCFFQNPSPPNLARGNELLFALDNGLGIMADVYNLGKPTKYTASFHSTILAETEKCAERFGGCISVLCVSIQSSKAGGQGCTQSVLDALRGHASRTSWYGWLFLLHQYPHATLDDSSALRTIIESWMQLGLVLDFYVASEGKDSATLRTRLCFWSQCEFHQKLSPKPLLVCKGCSEARRCSAVC